MYERDYIMWLIKEMIRAVLKLIFHIDTESPTEEMLEDSEVKATLNALLEWWTKERSTWQKMWCMK